MERNLRKTRVGLVTSDKMDKTIVVSIVDNVKWQRVEAVRLSQITPAPQFGQL